MLKSHLTSVLKNISFEMKEIGVTVDIVMKEEPSQSETVENTTMFLNCNSPDNDKNISERNNSKDLSSF